MDPEILIKVAADLSGLKESFSNNSVLWEKHNNDVAKGEKAIKSYVDTVVKENKKVDKAIQTNIDKVGAEGKSIQELEKKIENFGKKNAQSFDTKKIDAFNETLKKVSGNIENLDKFDISTEDIDYLTKKLSVAQDDFEALNILVDFFEDKMKSSASTVSDSFDVIKKKIEETKLNISSTEGFIKDIDKQIKTTAPGQDQANLIAERDAAKQALKEETVALADYQAQLKKAREENVSMATQLRRVKDELVQLELEGGRGSDRWIQLSNDAKKYNEAIRDTNAELNRTSKSTAGLDGLIGAATSIVALFTAAQGAIALFGDENENLEKSLVKVTGAIALLNGLQQIQTELTKKETLAGRALTFVRSQYAIATDAGAKSTLRLAAATKLLGIGLLVGALAAIVVYWKDISKFIGLTSDSTERLNAVNKKASESYGEQIAKLKILVDRVKEGSLSFKQKEEAVEDFNKTFGDTLGKVKSYAELEKKLIEQGAQYIKYLELKAKAEASYQLQVEKTKEALEKRNNDDVSIFNSVLGGFAGQSGASFQGLSDTKAASKLESEADAYGEILKKTQEEMEALSKSLGIVLDKPNKDLENALKKYGSLLEELINKQKSLKSELIESDREREKAILTDQLNAEKEKYKKEINDLKLSETAKQKLREEFNKLYNKETGLAYEEYRKTIAEIDAKYDEQIEKVRFNALQSIASVYDTSEQLEREAIGKKWDGIRKELENQIKLTNDDLEKEELRTIINYTFQAQGQEESDFDLDVGLNKIDREKEIADSILKIYQTNARYLIDNEELKQLQLLKLEKQYLDSTIKIYRDSIKSLVDKSLYDELIDTLQNSLDPSEIEDAGNKLRETLGDKTANEILKTVSALREVSKGIEDIGEKSNFEKLIDDFKKWTDSLESFSLKLAKTLGLEGRAAEEFANGVATAINSTLDSLTTIFDLQIQQHRDKVDSFQDSIDSLEEELDREKQLYEDGFANNYEARKADLEDLKARKKEEEEELKKAQKRKAALAKAELLVDTVSQLGNLITASSNIFKWASKIPFIGVPLAIGLITTMFGAFAIAKAKAFQAIGSGQNFRKGLQEGALSLKGPRHEDKGFGLYNSKTGERVAEFEDGEDVLVVNSQQKKKYKRVIDALIADAQGRGDIDSTLEGFYGVKAVGKQSLQVIKHVNEITVKTQKSKQEASEDNNNLINEIKELKDSFKKEFDGYKEERDGKTQFWETKDFYFVKKGNVTKKYRKE